MDAVFKALGGESRRKLLDVLHRSNGQTLTDLCGHLEMSRQAVTKHLALLEAADLVVTLRRGREKWHYLNPAPLHQIYERWIHKYERHRLQALSDLKKGLEEQLQQKPPKKKIKKRTKKRTTSWKKRNSSTPPTFAPPRKSFGKR
jgi:predicted transcriptional regulator